MPKGPIKTLFWWFLFDFSKVAPLGAFWSKMSSFHPCNIPTSIQGRLTIIQKRAEYFLMMKEIIKSNCPHVWQENEFKEQAKKDQRMCK